MAAPKGTLPPAAGMGRKKGVPNKITKELKEMILQALDESGGVEYLKDQAAANPASFMTLIGKVLPMTITGDSDSPIRHTIEISIVDPAH